MRQLLSEEGVVRMSPLRTPERLHMKSLEVELERTILELEERRMLLVAADGSFERLKVRRRPGHPSGRSKGRPAREAPADARARAAQIARAADARRARTRRSRHRERSRTCS